MTSRPGGEDGDADGETDPLELPPLDAADDPPPPSAEEAAIELADDDPGLEDAAADDLDVGGLLDADAEDGGDISAADAEADDLVDAGPDAVTDDEAPVVGEEAEGAAVEDGDDDLGRLEGDDADSGAEGLDEPIENEIDEASLPASDADDGTEEVDGDVSAALFDDDAPLPPWAGERWAARDGAGCDVPCVALAVDSGCVVAVADPAGAAARRPGAALVVNETDLSPRSIEAPSGAVAVAATTGRIVVATARGAVVLLPSANAAGATLRASSAPAAPAFLAAAPGRVWVASGSTLSFFEIGDGPTVVVDVEAPAGGDLLAIAASGATLVGLQSSGGSSVPVAGASRTLALTRRRGDDANWVRAALEPEASRAVGSGTLALRVAASGAAVAVVGDRGVALLREGRAARAIALPGIVDACFCGDRADADLALVVERPTAGTHVVRIPASGAPVRVAKLQARAVDDGDEPFANARIAWDESRELLWIAAPSGLSAVGGAPRH